MEPVWPAGARVRSVVSKAACSLPPPAPGSAASICRARPPHTRFLPLFQCKRAGLCVPPFLRVGVRLGPRARACTSFDAWLRWAAAAAAGPQNGELLHQLPAVAGPPRRRPARRRQPPPLLRTRWTRSGANSTGIGGGPRRGMPSSGR